MNLLKIAFYLTYVFWRKFFVKGDFLALSLIFVGLFGSLIGIYKTYTENYYLLFFFLLGTIFHHFNREDFSLLKNNHHWRIIILLEYGISNFPILLIFILKNDFINAIYYASVLIFCSFSPQKTQKFPLPFGLFDPLWHNTFRKYKLIFSIPIGLFFMIMAKIYHNENVAIFGILMTALAGSMPYFDREHQAHIAISFFRGKAYLHRQIFVGLLNYALISIPIGICVVVTNWELLFYFVLFFSIPLLGIFTKYTFFDSQFAQNIIFVFLLSGFFYGLPILTFPILYYISIKKINKMQYATN